MAAHMDIHPDGNGSNGHPHNGNSAKGHSHEGPLVIHNGQVPAADSDALDVRCPGCRKLLMRGAEIKCPRCKEIVKLDPALLNHPVVKALIHELAELKSRLGLVH